MRDVVALALANELRSLGIKVQPCTTEGKEGITVFLEEATMWVRFPGKGIVQCCKFEVILAEPDSIKRLGGHLCKCSRNAELCHIDEKLCKQWDFYGYSTYLPDD